MGQKSWTRFLVASVLLITIGFAISTMMLPPDPVSQLPGAVITVVLAVSISYWLVYRDRFSNLQSQIQN
jgi:membrane protein YdbS with pleckstrin-like domain